MNGQTRVRRVIAGEGMVVATSTFVTEYDGQLERIVEGRSRMIPEHEIVEQHPLAFVACEADDLDVRQVHAAAIALLLCHP